MLRCAEGTYGSQPHPPIVRLFLYGQKSFLKSLPDLIHTVQIQNPRYTGQSTRLLKTQPDRFLGGVLGAQSPSASSSAAVIISVTGLSPAVCDKIILHHLVRWCEPYRISILDLVQIGNKQSKSTYQESKGSRVLNLVHELHNGISCKHRRFLLVCMICDGLERDP